MAFFANMILFLALSLTIGLGSAWYALEKGLPMTTRTAGPWMIWHDAGKIRSDPYTTSYIARSGWLPITSSHALYYVEKSDDNGRKITSECSYKLSGKAIEADWWSLGVYNKAGGIIENKAQRYAFNSSNTVRNTNGSFTISISRFVQPGNWLPNNSGTENSLVFRIFGPKNTDETQASNEIEKKLPRIKRISCQ